MTKSDPDSDQRFSFWQKMTLWALGITAVVLSVYDVIVAFFNSSERDTISRIVQLLAYENWSFAFAFGALFVGHFFMPGKPILTQPWGFFTLLACSLGILFGFDLQGLSFKLHPIIFIGIGAIAGRLLWPMTAL